MAFGEDPRQYARLLAAVYDATMSGSRPPARPRDVVGESWLRVRAAGVVPDADGPRSVLDTLAVERRREASGLRAVVDDLAAGLSSLTADGDNILVIADRDGTVLWRSGSSRVLSHADRLGFVQGAQWGEKEVGTNAIGTALAARGPVQIFSAEHYARSHHGWTCTGAPIRDPRTGHILGVVDVSGPAATVHPTTLALVAAVAGLAESRLRADHLLKLDRLRTVAAPMIAAMSGPRLAVDAEGWVVAVGDLAPRSRITLPQPITGPSVWLPELGECVVDRFPGGWLIQPGGERVVSSAGVRVVIDVRPGRDPEVVVTGSTGTWRRLLPPRHAQILALIARAGEGRSAAQISEALFGDPGRVVTVRAEISRLRRSVAGLIVARPYRFADGVSVELLR
ncbi:diguanylate cyclase [Tsukamurella pseudospumae]|uniref:Diguanylate cyclase n=2 Tax=Tsukamurella pseudospumae TaxID=239498 RepID=A0A138AV25_9ACTN|nr:diguanylate cyclase [Tsukamurella pseudospumae]KXP14311.1 diguanylate cyclase [Tsukamurella pseudospumae]